MKVTVFGAHGRTGRHVTTQLLAAGHPVRAVVRSAAQVPVVTGWGARGVAVDLLRASTQDLRAVVAGAEAVVYTAGSAYGASAEEVDRLDGSAIIDAVEAAVSEGVGRFVVVSAHRTDEDFGPPSVVRLLRAKRAADAHLRSTTLGWTILRPDALNEEPATGTVRLDERVPHGALSRADLAAVIVTALAGPGWARTQFEVTGGDVPIASVLRASHPAG